MSPCPNPVKAQFAISCCHALITLHFLSISYPFPRYRAAFADGLLRELAGVTIPPERINGQNTLDLWPFVPALSLAS